MDKEESSMGWFRSGNALLRGGIDQLLKKGKKRVEGHFRVESIMRKAIITESDGKINDMMCFQAKYWSFL